LLIYCKRFIVCTALVIYSIDCLVSVYGCFSFQDVVKSESFFTVTSDDLWRSGNVWKFEYYSLLMRIVPKLVLEHISLWYKIVVRYQN